MKVTVKKLTNRVARKSPRFSAGSPHLSAAKTIRQLGRQYLVGVVFEITPQAIASFFEGKPRPTGLIPT